MPIDPNQIPVADTDELQNISNMLQQNIDQYNEKINHPKMKAKNLNPPPVVSQQFLDVKQLVDAELLNRNNQNDNN